LQFLVPRDTGAQPGLGLVAVLRRHHDLGLCDGRNEPFGIRYAKSFAAEAAMELEYERSEALLANILPASIADRLKEPGAQHHCR